MRLIKRYRNRRLYDTEEKRTITHERLRELMHSGEEFRILDQASERDITVEVMGRLFVSDSAAREPLVGDDEGLRDRLRELITEGGNVSMSILRNTVLASIGAFNVTKKKAEEIIDQLIESGDLTKSQRKEAVLELMDKAEKSTEEFRDKVMKQAGKVGAEVQQAVEKVRVAKKDDVDELNKKFDKLLKAVGRLEKKVGELG
jgi:polyhydroxyalkanoate synthesis repressor PhaR